MRRPVISLLISVAVLVDATVIRTVLLPESTKRLGDRNWHLPLSGAVRHDVTRRAGCCEIGHSL